MIKKLLVLLVLPLLITSVLFAQIDPTAPESECPYCGEKFPNQDMLNNHIQSVHTFVCSYCGEVFRSSFARNNHISEVHTFPCPYCGEVIIGDDAYDLHIETNHSYPCPYCGEVIIGEVAYESHIMEEHHYVCPYCDEVFTAESDLDNHLSINHECPYCDAILDDSLAMNEHIQTIHTYTCPYCSERIVGLSDYNEHLTSHECPYCDATFPDSNALNEHLLADHNFTCSFCLLRFYTQTDLDGHVLASHTNENILNERYLDRDASILVGAGLMRFHNPVTPEEPYSKFVIDARVELEGVAAGVAFSYEKPPDESTSTDSSFVGFASYNIRLGYLLSINRYLNLEAGVGYASTRIWETEDYLEGNDAHFSQYISADLCFGGSDPSRRMISSDRQSGPRSGPSRQLPGSTFYHRQFYIRPSIERTNTGWYPSVSAGIMFTEYTIRDN